MGGKLAQLEGLRGLAAAAIVAFHIDLTLGAAGGRLWLPYGWAAVDLFFVLSAFVLSLPIVRATGSGDALGWGGASWWGGYLQRRARRILPAYLVALALSALLLAGMGRPPAWWDVALHAVFAHTWSAATFDSINPVLWSLAVEVQMYLVLPFVAFSATRRGLAAPRALAVPIAVAVLGVGVRALAWGNAGMVAAMNLPGFLPHLGVGLLAAIAVTRATAPGSPDAPGWARHETRAPLLAVAVFLAVAVLSVMPPGDPGQGMQSGAHFVLVRPILAAASALLVAWAALGPVGVLSGRALSGLGAISYSLYLLHVPVLVLLGPLAASSPALFVAVGSLASLAIAAISYWAIERPFLAARRPPAPGAQPRFS